MIHPSGGWDGPAPVSNRGDAMSEEKQRPIMSRVLSFYGEQVSTKIPAIGDTNIKGHNNRRQIVFGISTGIAAGLLTSLTYFAGNMHLFTGSLPAVLATALTYGAVALLNAYRGKPIEEIAKEITDTVMGEEIDEPGT